MIAQNCQAFPAESAMGWKQFNSENEDNESKKRKWERKTLMFFKENIILLNCMIKSQKKKIWIWHKLKELHFYTDFFYPVF